MEEAAVKLSLREESAEGVHQSFLIIHRDGRRLERRPLKRQKVDHLECNIGKKNYNVSERGGRSSSLVLRDQEVEINGNACMGEVFWVGADHTKCTQQHAAAVSVLSECAGVGERSG